MIEIKKNSWSDITIKDYYKIVNALKMDNEADTAINIYAVLTDNTPDEIKAMNYSDFVKLGDNDISWINNKIEDTSKINKKIIINNKEYYYNDKATALTTSQFMDLQTLNSGDAKIEDLLSIIIIPKNKKYGEYDVDEVKEEIINYLDIVTAKSLINFLFASTSKSFRTILKYLSYQIKMMAKKEKGEKKQKLLEAQKQIKKMAAL